MARFELMSTIKGLVAVAVKQLLWEKFMPNRNEFESH